MSFDHHAYLVLRSDNGAREVILERVGKELGVHVAGNPDVVTEYFENLGIDDARHITELQSRRPVGGGTKVIIVQCEALTGEAQNALLKTFEEPARDTILFLCVPNEGALLPTLRSRLIIFDIEDGEVTEDNIPGAADFIDSNPKTRQAHIANIIENKDKPRAARFVEALIVEYQNRGGVQQYSEQLKRLMRAEKLLSEPGASVKLILEHLAVTL